MAKAETKTETKPSIRFCPKLIQHEAGIDFVQGNGIKVKITRHGYTAISMDDERKLLRAIEADPFCGICTWENREMPAEQRTAETELRKERAEKDAALAELDALREELKQLKGGKG